MWSEPRRAHPAGIITYVILSLRSGPASLAVGTVIPVTVILTFDRIPLALLVLVVMAVLLVTLASVVAMGYLRWLRLSFRLDGDTFFVEEGLLFRRTVRLSGQRIQAIDTQANVLFRMLGFVVLNVHTAGRSGAPEVSIPALSSADAAALTEALRTLKERSKPDFSADAGDPYSPLAEGSAPSIPDPSGVWILSERNLAIVAVTSDFLTPFLQLAGTLVVLMGLLPAIGDLLSGPNLFVVGLALPAIVALFLAAWFASAVSAALRYWDFSATRKGEEIQIERGLLNRSSRTVPFGRIQGIRLVQSLLSQIIGRFSVSADSAGVAGAEDGWKEASQPLGGSTVLHPLLTHQELRLFFETMLPGYTFPRLKKLPRRALPLYILRGTLLPLVVALPIAALLPYGWIALLVPVVTTAWSILVYHDAGLGTDGSTLLLRRRAIQRTAALIRRPRIQSLEISQNPLQRMLGLASLRVAIASSSLLSAFRIRDIDETDAWNLIEWVRSRSH